MSKSRQWLAVAVIVAAVAIAAVVATRNAGDDLGVVTVGSRAPDFAAVTLDSVPSMRTLADYKGKVTLINLWATWCLPCEKEMPLLEKLYEEFGPQGLKLVAISADAPGMEEPIREFMKQYKLTFDVLYDSRGNVKRDYMTMGFPESFLIGKDGIIHFKKVAAINESNTAELREIITKLLKENAD